MRRSDEEAFVEFATAHHDWLVRTGSALAGDPHAGQDLAQDSLVKAYARWRRVRSADNPRAYLRQILVRRAIDASRRPSRREHATDDPGPRHASPRDLASEHAERDRVGSAVDALPARQRQVVVLRFVEDLDVATTAELLRVREGTVKSATHAALAALRTSLTEHQEVDR
ncbi:SigE family RNA polymerase sigma factor [Angustibacter speluncae]